MAVLAMALGGALSLSACGSGAAGEAAFAQSPAASGTAVSPASGAASAATGFEVGEAARLALGTLQLEGDLTPDPDQASQLVFLWQAYGSLLESETAAAVEVESLLAQIRGAMSADQLEEIDAMDFDSEEVAARLRQYGGSTTDGQSGGGQGFRSGSGNEPAAGFQPRGGPGGGMLGPGGQGGQGGVFVGGEGGLTPEQMATAQAGRSQRQASGDMLTHRLLTPLIEHLARLADG